MALPTALPGACRPRTLDAPPPAEHAGAATDHGATARLLVLIARARVHRARHEEALAAGDAVNAALHLGRWQGVADALRLEVDLATEGDHG